MRLSIPSNLSYSDLELSLSLSESSLYISPFTSDDSSSAASNRSYDGTEPVVLNSGELVPVGTGTSLLWTQPISRMRGGFRYLTIVAQNPKSASSISMFDISDITCAISFLPHVPETELRSYAGYFYATDPVFHDKDFLTKVWYAGAYTLQTNIIDGHAGRDPNVASPGSSYLNTLERNF